MPKNTIIASRNPETGEIGLAHYDARGEKSAIGSRKPDPENLEGDMVIDDTAETLLKAAAIDLRAGTITVDLHTYAIKAADRERVWLEYTDEKEALPAAVISELDKRAEK